MTNKLIGKHHTGTLMKSRALEIIIALTLVLAATYLIFDAFNWRGKDLPWPLSGLFWA